MKILIATGGTGGHIYPALALAEILKKEEENPEIVFWGSTNRMESKLIPEEGYPFYGAKMSGMTRGVLAKVKSVMSLLQANRYAKKVIAEQKPDVVVGFGNYISVPIVLAAKKAGIPVMLHEQNSFMGKANVFLAKKADTIAISYESNRQQLPQYADKMRFTGNPQATLARDTVFDEALAKSYGLDLEKPFVVCMMGSLGSESVSQVVDETCDLLDKDYQMLIAVGKSNDYTFQHKSDGHICVVPFIDGKTMLKGCSLAVVRAGATTMAELTAIGVPSILIPSPNVANNHQVYNAQELVKADAGVMIEEKDLTKENLAHTINGLMHDPERREQMRIHAQECGKAESAYEMIAWIKELIG